MNILRDGTFSFTVGTEELSRGLRPSKRSPRNSKFLVESISAVGIDGVLQVIDDLNVNKIVTELSITDGFPYPQIFVFVEFVLICGETSIYEWDGAALTSVLGPVAAGDLWSMVDFQPFIYASNRTVAAFRDADSGLWSVTTNYPIAGAICDFNGQVLVGSPVEEPSA